MKILVLIMLMLFFPMSIVALQPCLQDKTVNKNIDISNLLHINNWNDLRIRKELSRFKLYEEILLAKYQQALLDALEELDLCRPYAQAIFLLALDNYDKSAWYASTDAAQKLTGKDWWNYRWNEPWFKACDARSDANDDFLVRSGWYKRALAEPESFRLIAASMRQNLAAQIYEGTYKALRKLKLKNAQEIHEISHTLTNIYALAYIGEPKAIKEFLLASYNALLRYDESQVCIVPSQEIASAIAKNTWNKPEFKDNPYILSFKKVVEKIIP